jgi:hypothetical protein
LSFSRYMQRGTWKLGGRPSGTEGEYEPLRARLINAGVVYRF